MELLEGPTLAELIETGLPLNSQLHEEPGSGQSPAPSAPRRARPPSGVLASGASPVRVKYYSVWHEVTQGDANAVVASNSQGAQKG